MLLAEQPVIFRCRQVVQTGPLLPLVVPGWKGELAVNTGLQLALVMVTSAVMGLEAR